MLGGRRGRPGKCRPGNSPAGTVAPAHTRLPCRRRPETRQRGSGDNRCRASPLFQSPAAGCAVSESARAYAVLRRAGPSGSGTGNRYSTPEKPARAAAAKRSMNACSLKSRVRFAQKRGIGQARESAAFIRSGVIGTRRMRTPVASKMAFAIAAGIVRVDGSPAPCGAISAGR